MGTVYKLCSRTFWQSAPAPSSPGVRAWHLYCCDTSFTICSAYRTPQWWVSVWNTSARHCFLAAADACYANRRILVVSDVDGPPQPVSTQNISSPDALFLFDTKFSPLIFICAFQLAVVLGAVGLASCFPHLFSLACWVSILLLTPRLSKLRCIGKTTFFLNCSFWIQLIIQLHSSLACLFDDGIIWIWSPITKQRHVRGNLVKYNA